MNARITPVEYRKDLNEYQRNEIIRTATSKRDPYLVRAEKLRKIPYATDACKFELLEARIEKDLYNTLYALYFGEVLPDQEKSGKISDIKKLTRYHRKLIVGSVLRPEDSITEKIERLRKLTIADDEVKFQVLRESDLISQELYDTIYALYFGEALPDQEGEDAAENAANAEENEANAAENAASAAETEENAAEMQQKKTERRSYTIWDEADVMTLIHYYNKGASAKELAAMFDRSTQQIRDKLKALKKDYKYREMFNMDNGTKTEQEQKFEEIISSVDAGSQRQESQPDKPEPKSKPDRTDGLPKSFTAKGTGFITTDGGLKLDEEPITAMLRQKIVELGLVQFWGEVSIVITPGRPAGMIVSVEE